MCSGRDRASGGNDEQGSAVGSPERAGETAAVDGDRLEHFAAWLSEIERWCRIDRLETGGFAGLLGSKELCDFRENEASVPQFFVPNVFSFATEGKDLRYGTVGMPVELWGPWREETTDDDAPAKIGLVAVKEAVEGVLKPAAVLDFLRFFTVYATDKKHRKIKIIARYQQFQATNLIVERVLPARSSKGLIWHFQGSGKSLLMVFAALKLRLHRRADEPDGPDRRRPHRPRHPDHRHVQRLRRPRTWCRPTRAPSCRRCSARARGRSSSRRSTSSARRPACSTTATTSSRWSTRPTARRRATSGGRCARRCRTRSCSA